MHCNLRPPDIAPSFSAHNAPVYKFNNSASARDVSTIGEYYHSVFGQISTAHAQKLFISERPNCEDVGPS